MKRWNIYTPEGVQDILFSDCRLKRRLEADLRTLFTSRGFMEIETPTIEFYDVFGGERGLIRQESMYKFCDAKGRLLVLRPDMTIPVARVVSSKIKDEAWPLKCCYIGNSFCFDELGGGKRNEYTQAGIEILGVLSPEADAEAIAMAVKAVKACGIDDFQIDIGQVDFFKGIMEESGLSRDEAEEVRELIDLKDFVGVEQVMNRHNVKPELKKLILDLPRLFGNADILSRISQENIGRKAADALTYLKAVLEILDDKGLSRYVSIDLGMVQSLNYYTGIVFRGYTLGVGFQILSGGRYDNLVSKFGKDCPATGFSMGVNLVMMALERQSRVEKTQAGGCLVTYEKGARRAADAYCEGLIERGEIAELDIAMNGIGACMEYARSKGLDRVVVFRADGTREELVVHPCGG
jgi:ATP phosphoribosyltransferase regulatory subunit